jgi:D-glycero-beta-D-manno-heptose 1-phosphate adenylyltransferase
MPTLSSLDIIRNKILDQDKLINSLTMWRFLSKKIVFTNGCFDIIHLGHIDYLSKASDEGDVLIVGLNSDSSTAKLKGPSRPINNQVARAMILASFQFVSAVVIFDEPTPYQLISTVQPDVLIKGGDYRVEQIVGFDIVKAKNGIIKTIDFLEGYSTSGIEEKIRSFKKS